MKIKLSNLVLLFLLGIFINTACSNSSEPELEIIVNPDPVENISGVQNLESAPLSPTSIILEWVNNNQEQQEGLLIERKKANDDDYIQIKSIPNNSKYYIDQNLDVKTVYKYRIRAFRSNLFSIYTNETSVSTYEQVAENEFMILNTFFKGGSNGTVNNPSRSLAYVSKKAELSQYGGTKSVQLAATGHFRTTQYNGAWNLVDPEGYLYFGIGVNSVKSQGTYSTVKLPEDLTAVGFNHVANWSDYAAINSGASKIPYVFRELFLQGYKNTTQRTNDLFSVGVIPVFDSEFLTFSDNLAQVVAVNKDDPYCIGVFSDNELPLYSNSNYGELLDRFLAITDKLDPNYLAATDWMTARKGSGYVLDAQDRVDFHGYIASTYHQIVHTAIKTYAPNMLYLGSRLHGAAKDFASIFRDSAPYIDVFSVNYYGRFEPDTQQLEMWESESNKPFIISEFYAKGFDVGLDNTNGAGYHVPTQKDRALYFENFAIKLLESKGCVGYQWFKFQDDDSNRGLINTNEDWYFNITNSLEKFSSDIYNLRSYLRK